MRRLLRVPLVQFLLIGAVLLVVRARWEARAGAAARERPRIVLTLAKDVVALRYGHT